MSTIDKCRQLAIYMPVVIVEQRLKLKLHLQIKSTENGMHITR